jgi:gliding motility-associated-like protein
MHIYSEEGNIKYDLILHQGADISKIQIEYLGTDGLRIADNKLYIKTSLGESVELAPYSYQFVNGEKKEVACRYKLEKNIVSFVVTGKYDKSLDLYIDPTLIFCSFTGSTADNWGFTAANDTLGNFYAGGITSGQGYPVTLGVIQPVYGGGSVINGSQFPCDATFTKFNANGTTALFATYLGGSDNDQPHSIIIDKNDNLCIAGRTYSSNFPVSAGCYDNSYNGGADMFITKLNSTGTAIVGSTYIGGSGDDGVNEEAIEFIAGVLKHNYADDARSEIIFDNANNVYIASCSESANFPVTPSAFQPALTGLQDAVIFELNNDCSNLIWSTFAGGSNNDAAYVLSLNKTNPTELFVAGGTMSNNFPSTAGVHQPAYQGGQTDGFLMKFNTTTKALTASTFIGTNQYDQVYGVQTDDSNHVYITGQTLGAYPVSAGVYSNPGSSQFIAKFNTTLTTQMLSTVYGSGTLAFTNVSPNAFLVDKCQNIYVSGWGGNLGFPISSSTAGMPTTPNALQPTTDGNDFYFIVLSKNMQSLVYGSFFGQNGGVSEHVDGGTSRFDANGVIYQAICAACGASQLFPTSTGVAYPQNLSPNCNLAALKISFDLQNPDAVAAANGPLTGCAPLTIQFQNSSTSATAYSWDFGDGSPLDFTTNPSHTYTTAGIFTLTLIASNPNGCTVSADTTQLVITVKNDSLLPSFTYMKIDSCGPFSAQITNTSTYNNATPPANAGYSWDFGDGTSYVGQFPPLHNFPAAATYTITLTMTDPNACNNPATFQLVIDFSTSIVKSAFIMPDSICLPALVNFLDQSTNATTWNWTFGDGNTSSVQNPSNNYLTIGTYTVFLVSGNPNTCNKLDSSSKVLTVLPTPNADFSWSPNPPEPNTPNEFTNLSTGATKYLWDFGDGTTSTNKDDVHIYEKDGTYTVCLTATNEYGCRDTACKSVRGIVVPLVDVPSGFSPNGDGINDIVYVKGYGIDKMTFRIFNRWGEKVFESTEKSKGWDGRYKDKMQEMEVYAYTLAVEFFDGTKTNKSGNITLLK